MKLLKTTLTLAGLLTCAAPAFAHEPIRPDRARAERQGELPDDHRDRRDHWGDREHRGLRLSPAERRRIAEYQTYVTHLEREAWRDGVITRVERLRISRARQTLERMLWTERHDGDRR